MYGFNPNAILQNLSSLKSIAGGNPQAAFNFLMQSNPQFKQFVQANQGKSPEEIAKAHGIDISQLQQFMK